MFFTSNDLVNNVDSNGNPDACSASPNNLCGCAWGNFQARDGIYPRRSEDHRIQLNGQHNCSWLELIRHETAHVYGYNHFSAPANEFQTNFEKVRHCINNHQIH